MIAHRLFGVTTGGSGYEKSLRITRNRKFLRPTCSYYRSKKTSSTIRGTVPATCNFGEQSLNFSRNPLIHAALQYLTTGHCPEPDESSLGLGLIVELFMSFGVLVAAKMNKIFPFGRTFVASVALQLGNIE